VVLGIGDCTTVPTSHMRNSATKHGSIGTKPSVVHLPQTKNLIRWHGAQFYDFKPCMISETNARSSCVTTGFTHNWMSIFLENQNQSNLENLARGERGSDSWPCRTPPQQATTTALRTTAHHGFLHLQHLPQLSIQCLPTSVSFDTIGKFC
jgi:hypothetical protein